MVKKESLQKLNYFSLKSGGMEVFENGVRTDKVVRYFSLNLLMRNSSAYVHLPEELSGIARDDFGLEMFGNADTQRCFSYTGRTQKDDKRWRGILVQ